MNVLFVASLIGIIVTNMTGCAMMDIAQPRELIIMIKNATPEGGRCSKYPLLRNEKIPKKTAVRRGNIFRSARLLFVLCVNYDLFGICILMSTLRSVRMIHTKNRMTRIGIRQDVTIMTARASIR